MYLVLVSDLVSLPSCFRRREPCNKSQPARPSQWIPTALPALGKTHRGRKRASASFLICCWFCVKHQQLHWVAGINSSHRSKFTATVWVCRGMQPLKKWPLSPSSPFFAPTLLGDVGTHSANGLRLFVYTQFVAGRPLLPLFFERSRLRFNPRLPASLTVFSPPSLSRTGRASTQSRKIDTAGVTALFGCSGTRVSDTTWRPGREESWISKKRKWYPFTMVLIVSGYF